MTNLDVPALDGARVLVVEDDAALRRVLVRGLGTHGAIVVDVGDGAGAMTALDATGQGAAAAPDAADAAAPRSPFDAFVIDIGLPDADGRDVCQALRARGVNAPVVFLTAMGAVGDLVSGFAAGADDYIAKPFDFPELLVRLDALLRRSRPATTPGVVLDPLTHAARVGDAVESLTPTEYRILGALIAAPGTVLRRGELIRAAWPDGAIVHDNTLDQYVARLRRKLAKLTDDRSIVTAHGVGYAYE